MKNLGIGIDIVEIERFRKLPYKYNEPFYKKIFSNSEIKYCLSYKNSSQHFAGKFALKEAVVKSIREKIKMRDIITTNISKNKPDVVLAKKLPYKFLVSISHEKNYAIAVAISFIM
jgi:holo-[acyl-carrier protein] synthase